MCERELRKECRHLVFLSELFDREMMTFIYHVFEY